MLGVNEEHLHCLLTETLRVKLSAHRTDACFSGLSLLQLGVQEFLQAYNICSGTGCTGHFLHPRLVSLCPFPALPEVDRAEVNLQFTVNPDTLPGWKYGVQDVLVHWLLAGGRFWSRRWSGCRVVRQLKVHS